MMPFGQLPWLRRNRLIITAIHCIQTPTSTSINYFTPGRVAKYCDESVCLSTPLNPKARGRPSPNFLCMLSVAVAWFSSDGFAIRYVPYFRFYE